MPDAHYDIGESFRVQFVWKIPDNDYLRAIFSAEVLHLDSVADKYVVRLTEFLAGRQETKDGEIRSIDQVNKDYWLLINDLTGKKISLAFETDDGRPLWLRFATLTGEHNFFRRLNELPPQLAAKFDFSKAEFGEEPD